ncbi:hypothetical protein LOAG_12722 [Loa loa]|uniref:Uncharacterized protein n=1 Tax=Loa loa TaxID=7209 RepID=A0A1S0TKQ7_LOALO|nr:hypothetical protein LOAG_12722 [Loa loa]EFO15787.2 hypothetical protein LOAG_12722 [Loa loa]
MALLERMWLATLLLILAAFQFYIFFTVIKCCLYLQEYQNERLRRIRQFEECSKRVRDAKRNGLWRYTSWGGSFQQYVGEYDNDKNKLKKRDKPPGHVQWNLQANTELDEPKDTSNSVEISKQLKTIRNDKQDRQSNVIRSISANDNQSKFYYNDHVERISRSLLSLNKEKVDKQFPKSCTSTTSKTYGYNYFGSNENTYYYYHYSTN